MNKQNSAKMKFFILLAIVASATAVPYGLVNTGASAVSRSDDVSDCDNNLAPKNITIHLFIKGLR